MDKVQLEIINLGTISIQMKHKTLNLFEITKGMHMTKSQIRKLNPGALQHLDFGGKEQVRETKKEEPQR